MKKTIIDGKNYTTVHERLKAFKADHPDYDLISEYTFYPEQKMFVVVATLILKNRDGIENTYTGLAYEVIGWGNTVESQTINLTSALENAQTSAWGRAFAAAGYGIDDGIASADEVKQATTQLKEQRLNKSAERAIKNSKDGGLPPIINACP